MAGLLDWAILYHGIRNEILPNAIKSKWYAIKYLFHDAKNGAVIHASLNELLSAVYLVVWTW